MGCTSSRETPANPTDLSQVPAARVTSVPQRGRAISTQSNRPAGPLSRPPLPNDPSSHVFSTRPNKPIRAPSPVLRCPPERALQPWTPSQLQREREAFFETRVTGDPAVWSAVRLICDMLRAGDVEGAQGMMDAVGLTCPTGRIKSDKTRGNNGERRKGGLFDEQGRGYDIPGWIIKDPEDLLPEPSMPEKELDGASDDDDEWTDDGEGGKRRRDEKGKGRAESIGDLVNIRARLSDRGSDVQVEIGTNQKVRALIKRVSEEAGGKKVKLMYLGKILAEDKSLADQGWQQGHVINALVFD